MEPKINYNDLIVVEKCEFAKLKEGDIITFLSKTNRGQIAITHEIIGITIDNDGQSFLKTKGINIEKPDPVPVTIDGANNTNKYIGKYAFKSSFIGQAVAYLKTPLGLLALFTNIIGIYIIVIISKKERPKAKQWWQRGAKGEPKTWF